MDKREYVTEVEHALHKPHQLLHPFFHRPNIDIFMHGVCAAAGRNPQHEGRITPAERDVGVCRAGRKCCLQALLGQAILCQLTSGWSSAISPAGR